MEICVSECFDKKHEEGGINKHEFEHTRTNTHAHTPHLSPDWQHLHSWMVNVITCKVALCSHLMQRSF